MTTPVGVLRHALCLLFALGACAPERRTPAATGGEGGDGGSGGSRDGACTVTKHVEIPLDLFGDLAEPPAVVPFGERFAVVASGSVSQSRAADVAVVSWQGVELVQHFELLGLCPDDVCRNLHGSAVLAKTAGGSEFLLAEQGSSTSMKEYPLRLMAWSAEASEPAISPLFDSRVGAITTRSDMKSSRDGARALFALGNIDTTPLQAVEISEGAALVAAASPLELLSTPWDWLAVVPTDEAGAISAMARLPNGNELTWQLRELDSTANVVLETSVTVPVGDALGYVDPPTLVESSAGFHAQWVSSDGASTIATVARAAEPGATPALLRLDVSPGTLEAVLGDEFLFRAPIDAAHQGFVRRKGNGETGGPPIVLPVLPAPTSDRPRALPHVLRVVGESVQLTYELDNVRVIEELGACVESTR
jgi:hypothetical protein